MPSDFDHIEQAANSILRLAGDIRASWTDRQVEVIRKRRTLPRKLQKDLAQELGVSPSVVSEVLRAARYEAVREAEEVVVILLNRAAAPESFRPDPTDLMRDTNE
jgi:predicted transcriptional regulator